MAVPVETYKLPRGMGRLIRHIANGPWTWQKWDTRRKKWVCTPTNEANRSKAEQFVYQQAAIKDFNRFRYQGIKILFTTIADEYLKVRAAGKGYKKLRPASLRKTRTAIAAFNTYVGPGYETLCIDQVDSVLLTEFIESEGKRLSVDAANRNLNFIGKILEFAHKKNLILHNPAPKVERAIETDPEKEDEDEGLEGYPCPTPEHACQILAHAAPKMVTTGERVYNGSELGRPVYSGINKNDYSDLYAAICLTGMRIGEARHLTWPDVDLINKVILIRAGKKNGKWWQPKSRQGIRRIAIVPELETILKRLRRTNRKKEWVFETRRGTQVHPHNVAKRFREICEELGFEKHYVVHSLRKYWASTVAQQGLDWKLMIKMFGHSDFELILSTYYAQNDDARLVAETSKIDFGLGLPKTG